MDGFIGEVRLMAFDFTPELWLPCDGATYSIMQFQALAAIIGNRFGGDGKSTFAVPDLRGRTVVGAGDDPEDTFDPTFASIGGVNTVALSTVNMPSHTHTLVAGQVAPTSRLQTAAGNYISALARVPTSGTSESGRGFVDDAGRGTTTPVQLNNATLTPFNGQGQPHENRQPYLAMRYFICYSGEFPVRE